MSHLKRKCPFDVLLEAAEELGNKKRKTVRFSEELVQYYIIPNRESIKLNNIREVAFRVLKYSFYLKKTFGISLVFAIAFAFGHFDIPTSYTVRWLNLKEDKVMPSRKQITMENIEDIGSWNPNYFTSFHELANQTVRTIDTIVSYIETYKPSGDIIYHKLVEKAINFMENNFPSFQSAMYYWAGYHGLSPNNINPYTLCVIGPHETPEVAGIFDDFLN